ncbi:uncharacterized protein PSANT_02798 [Moesziomyces antarcticus]|uniref:Uncharacterized protein n=1 Tax=Pseudozyma antarctica TaxID=84753 RepID=A0A5C3FL80_PSEA2|nr:uncharacterized protein PSANT_02798 [Moesziomyces antarcticus]
MSVAIHPTVRQANGTAAAGINESTPERAQTATRCDAQQVASSGVGLSSTELGNSDESVGGHKSQRPLRATPSASRSYNGCQDAICHRWCSMAQASTASRISHPRRRLGADADAPDRRPANPPIRLPPRRRRSQLAERRAFAQMATQQWRPSPRAAPLRSAEVMRLLGAACLVPSHVSRQPSRNPALFSQTWSIRRKRCTTRI